ncbi:MAG: tetratricopeptide repeat protein [Planctomycetes bacterium]|nr:tetratricopeptide repeat protein [Planctomycetota bacterium]
MVLLTGTTPLWAVTAKSLVKQGNQAYASGDYLKAVEQYDQALADTPKAVVPLFNKANSYYHMDDLDEAIALYRDVDFKAKDMSLVEKARYNLGNCAFQQGLKQRDSDLQKAVDLMKDGISHWQRTLKVNPKNPKAGRNIEVARLTIKDIMDQIKQQQDQQENDPNQPQDPNQQQQPQSSDQQNPSQDPNQSQDPQENQPQQDPNEGDSQDQPQDQEKDPNESPQSQPQPDQAQEKKDKIEQDMTAQAILDKEQRQNEERKKRQRSSYQKVDRDW